MATYAITLNERSARGKALIEYLQALGVLISKITPKAVNKPKEYDITKTAGYREAMDDVKNGRVTHYDSLKDFYKEMGL